MQGGGEIALFYHNSPTRTERAPGGDHEFGIIGPILVALSNP
jgi:hypothetical protein